MSGFRRLPELLAVIAASALASGAACKKDEEQASEKQPAGKTTADPAEGGAAPTGGSGVVGQALIEQVDKCWGLIESWDKVAVANCAVEKPDASYMDAVMGPTKATTNNDLMVEAGTFRNEYSEFKADRVLILANGNKALAVVLVTGKHRSGARVSTYQVEVSEHDREGRTTRAEYYREEATIMHQLGVLESASAPKSEKPWEKRVRQVARGDDTERANLDLVKKGIEAMGKGDVAGAQAMYAPDAMLRYVPEAKPYNGAGEIQARLQASANLGVKMEIRDAWAAGDWVAVAVTSSATTKEEVPGAKGSKGKPWTIHSEELFRVEGGKVKEHWIFANGIKWAFDIGLFDPKTLESQ